MRESWMHVEIDRIGHDEDIGRDRRRPAARCCATSARPSRTGRRCTPQALRHRRRPRASTRRRCPRTRSSAGAALLRWLADDHFTFLGYREYHLEHDGDERRRVLRAVPGTGSASCAATRTCRPSFGKLPAAGRGQGAREAPCWCWPRPTPAPPCTARRTSTTSASRSSTPNGEVVGERRFLGLFSSAAYTESADPDPGAAREGHGRSSTASASTRTATPARPCMDILETYPRDELFHTPVDELVPIAEAVHAHPRAPPAAAVRAPRHLRALLCRAWSTCPATATTPRSASGSRRSSRQQLRRRVASSSPRG